MRNSRSLFVAVVVGVCVSGACSRSPEAASRAHLDAGNVYAEQKKFDKAVVEYRNAVKQNERSGDARLKLAQAYEQTHDRARALREYVRAADLLPDSVDAQVSAARYLVLAGQFEDARARAERALVLDPRNVQAQLVLGSALVGMKDLDGAVREVEAAIALDPLDVKARTSLGVLEIAKGDAQRAETAFTEAVGLQPRSVDARIALASFYWLRRRTAEAEQALKAALEIDPTSALVNRALAAFFIQTGRPADAEGYLKRLADRGDSQSRLALADYYTSMRRWADATAILTVLEGDKSHALAASLRLATIAYADRRTTEAHRIVDDLLARGGTPSQALLLKARFLLAENRTEAAIDRLKAAITADPKSAAAPYMLGNAHFSRSDLPAAADSYRAALQVNPNLVAAQLQLSRVSLLRGDASAAVDAAQRVIDKQPDNPIAKVMLIDGLLAKRDLARAEQEAMALKRKYPAVAAVHVMEGKLLTLKQNLPAAGRAFTQALTIDPSSLDAAVGLVGVDIASGDVATARRRAEALLGRMPDDPAIRMLTARVYAAANEASKAEALLQQVLQQAPANTAALGTLGDLYLRDGKLAQALQQFEALSVREPKSITVQTMVAIILQRQKRTEEAKKRYELVLELDPNTPVAANNLAWMLAEQGQDLDRALRLATSAAEQRPDDPQVHDTIGWIYYQKQLPSMAIGPLQRAVDRDPNNASFHFHLGLALAAAGEAHDARVHLEKALALSPEFDGAMEARRVLGSLKG